MRRLSIAMTGASGFVGQAVARALVERGHMVKALLRQPGRVSLPPLIEAVAGDLENNDALRQLTKDADAVLHLAGAIKSVGRGAFFAVNEQGTRNVIRHSVEAGVLRFVHVSSLAARRPELSHYAASKRAAEEVVRREAGAISTLIVRPSAVYGPGDMATLPLLKMLMSTVAVLPGRKDARFSLIHVDDLARVLLEAIEGREADTVEVDDLQGGHDWNDLAAVTREFFGMPGRTVHIPYGLAMGVGGAADLWASLTGNPQMISAGKFREMYQREWVAEGRNWPRTKPIPLAEGLPQTIRWYQAQGLLPLTPGADTRQSTAGHS